MVIKRLGHITWVVLAILACCPFAQTDFSNYHRIMASARYMVQRLKMNPSFLVLLFVKCFSQKSSQPASFYISLARFDLMTKGITGQKMGLNSSGFTPELGKDSPSLSTWLLQKVNSSKNNWASARKEGGWISPTMIKHPWCESHYMAIKVKTKVSTKVVRYNRSPIPKCDASPKVQASK